MRNYAFKTKPYQHQMDALEASADAESYALLMDMGTGKSKVLVDTIAYLDAEDQINSAVILAPKGVYKNWVGKELPAHLATKRHKVAYWASPLTNAHKDAIREIWKPDEYLHILVMNIEALSGGKAEEVATKFIKSHGGRTLIAIDESTVIKNHKAARTKAAIRLSKLCNHKRILTGSPITKTPLDLFAQFQFLGEKLLGFKSYYAFCSRYADMIKRTAGGGGHQYNQILGFRNLDELTKSIKPYSFRVTKEECLDLPEKTYTARAIDLTPKQKKAYEQVEKSAVALLGDMEMVPANAVITQLLRLHQISCGFVNTDDGNVIELKNNRMSELMGILEELQGKAIIWANYRHDILAIEREISKVHGSSTVATYFGDTDGEERQAIVERFQESEDLRFFVGQPRTGGYGLTLTAANTVIYYSNSYDLEVRLQSEDRAHRIGQTKAVTYIDLIAPKTVDEKIVNALRKKINIATQVLEEDWKKWLI
jgi:SNF2 family DNA or RNA helicase